MREAGEVENAGDMLGCGVVWCGVVVGGCDGDGD